MLTKTGPKVLEFNCRLGDPEAQAIIARMDFDLAEVLADAAAKQLDPAKFRWKKGASVCVVLTSGGYPGKFDAGKAIDGLTSIAHNSGVQVFQAGTRLEHNSLLTNGGRVLGVTAVGDSLDSALSLAYQAAQKIHFAGMHYRKDIGAQAQAGHVKAAGD
jgi:phosphoribosylamine---glycine ligase